MGGKFTKFKILLQKYEHLLDKILGEFNMEPISVQLMHPNCKAVHAPPYTVPRLVEQQLQAEQGNFKIGGHWNP
jgi:hypothetical protein